MKPSLSSNLLRVLCIGLAGLAILIARERSLDACWLGYSRLRWIGLVAFSGAAIAGWRVSRYPMRSVQVLLILVSVSISWAAAETLLWWNPFLMPAHFLQEMPQGILHRAMALESRRRPEQTPQLPFDLLTRSYVTEGYLRRLKPHQTGWLRTEDPDTRWVEVTVDENGFRNPPGLYSGSAKLEVILLGDSFTRGTSSRTIADWLRDLSGLSVYSLGDLGGAPQHWGLAFKRFGQSKAPRWVVANFYEGNDLRDAARLERIMEQGLTLDDYYGRPARRTDRWLGHSAVFSLLRALASPRQTSESVEAVLFVNGQETRIPLEHTAPDDSVGTDRGLEIVQKTLQEIVHQTDARVALSYIPTAASVYADRAVLIGARDPAVWKGSFFRQQALSKQLAQMAQRQGIVYVDVTPDLRAWSGHERLYGDAGHFNQAGYRAYAQLLIQKLGRRLQTAQKPAEILP